MLAGKEQCIIYTETTLKGGLFTWIFLSVWSEILALGGAHVTATTGLRLDLTLSLRQSKSGKLHGEWRCRQIWYYLGGPRWVHACALTSPAAGGYRCYPQNICRGLNLTHCLMMGAQEGELHTVGSPPGRAIDLWVRGLLNKSGITLLSFLNGLVGC